MTPGISLLSQGSFFSGQPEKAHPIGQPVLFEIALTIFDPLPKTKAPEGFPRSTVTTESDIFTRY
jgi:hypothetical protein